MAGDIKIGMMASEECKQPPSAGQLKPWFHIRAFLDAFESTLYSKDYEIVATGGTGEIIKQHKPCWFFRHLPPTFRGVVQLAARVARGEVERILFFQDPDDLQVERPENYALLRNCNLHGKKLCINQAARLWAEYEQGGRVPLGDPDPAETVVFIAHDEEKPRMARFARHYIDRLGKFKRLLATSGTKRYIDDYLKERFPRDRRLVIERAGATTAKQAHGPAGGDVVIADEILKKGHLSEVEGVQGAKVLYHVLFFIDHKSAHPHEPDIQVLLRTCVDPTLGVNLILNSEMAEEWIERY